MIGRLVLGGVHAGYQRGTAVVSVLRGVDLEVAPGEIVVVRGRSGTGKTTLLQIAGALARPTTGNVVVAGTDLAGLDAAGRARLRRSTIGFVFQAFHLLPGLSALENAALPLTLAGMPRRQAELLAAGVLEEMGLGHRAGHRPNELSGGEAQRVAVARAVVNDPALVLADEPTGNLDDESGASVLDALVARTRARSAGCVIATHDDAVAARADRCLMLADGRLESAPAPAGARAAAPKRRPRRAPAPAVA